MTSRIGPLPLAIKATLLPSIEASKEEIEAFKEMLLYSKEDKMNKS